MPAKEQVIQKLEEVRDQIPSMKSNGVQSRDTPEFGIWKETGIKWLKLGLPHTTYELEEFQYLRFAITRMRMAGEGYGYGDQQRFEKDCALATHLLSSAIENIKMELVPD
jgi:hypothetical protein